MLEALHGCCVSGRRCSTQIAVRVDPVPMLGRAVLAWMAGLENADVDGSGG
ncbi:hypothetical protein [Nonomuraea sp. NPDC005650]|uniref:hypothetical protein n=1 Tax=Nonomuraea sp. NPDC005650 TaxID=3157045 RepID=UPI0033AB7D92